MKRIAAMLVTLAYAALLFAADEPVAPLGSYTARERGHWEFQPRKDPAVPQFTDAAGKAWVKTPVDAFILTGLRKAGLKPAPAADRATLIRRVTFDLTGLPPTLEEIDAFVADTSANAWEKVVDRLLASPHYGEQWGRHWLDVVRFAESDGYEYDMHRPDAWRYRDYVVQSFNDDKPYDDFVKEQLAGDEMDAANKTYLVASGFNRLGPLRKNAGNQDVASSHNEVLTEMTNIVGAAFLGRHRRLRALPRSQVRSLPPIGLLPPAGSLRAVAAERHRAGQPGRAGRLEGQGRAGGTGEAAAASATAARARWREGQVGMQTRRARRQDAARRSNPSTA